MTACGRGGSEAVVAVGSRTLDAASLEGLVRASPPGTDPLLMAQSAAEAWLDYSLAATAAADSLDPADPALVAAALAPTVRSQHLIALQNLLAGERSPLPRAELRRVYALDSVKLFQTILVRVPDWSDEAGVRARAARADSLRMLALRGASFSELVRRYSEAGYARFGGYGPLVTREEVPAEHRDEVWALAPGAVAGFRSEAGYELVKRPVLADVTGPFAAGLLVASGRRADSAFADSLVAAEAPTELAGAAGRFRRLLLRPDSLATDTTTLVRFRSGGLDVAAAWAWAVTLPDPVRIRLAWDSDQRLSETLAAVARNELLYRVARARGIDVDPADLGPLRTDFVNGTRRLFAALRVRGGPGVDQPGVVDSLLLDLLKGSPVPAMPAGLAGALRARIPHLVTPDEVNRVGLRARSLGLIPPAPNPRA